MTHSNTFYRLINYVPKPHHSFLSSPNTICLYNTSYQPYIARIPYQIAQLNINKISSVVLVNPSSEDLTYLTILGASYYQAVETYEIGLYANILNDYKTQ